MKAKYLIVILFSLLLFPKAYPFIDLHSTIFTTNDGLENNFVRHIYQDSKGFMWMSTLNGLTRYDGHTFITFQPEKSEQISLLDHHVRKVAEDKNNFLWIDIAPDYYNCYDLKHERFVDFTGKNEQNLHFSHRYQSSNGDTWLRQSNNGCRRVRYKDGEFSSVKFNKSNGKLPSNIVRAFSEDKNGIIWVCTDKGLAKVNNENTQILNSELDFIDIVFYKDKVYALTSELIIYTQSADGSEMVMVTRLLSGSDLPTISSIFLYADQWVILSSAGGRIFRMTDENVISDSRFNVPNGQTIIDDKGNYFIYDSKGLIRYINSNTGRIKDFQIPIKDRPTDQWCKIIQDSRGLIWIATFGNGLYIYDPDTDETRAFDYRIDSKNHIVSNSLAFIAEDRTGGIWISSESAGISHITVLSDNIKFIYPENVNITDNSNAVRLIYQLSDGDILISNREGDLYHYDDQLKQIAITSTFPSSIYSLLEEPKGVVWYGSRAHGIFKSDFHKTKSATINLLPGNRVTAIYSDFKNRIWLSAYNVLDGTTNDGLTLAVSDKGHFKFSRYLNNRPMDMGVRYITADHDNWMWVGTNNGLCVFHPDSIIENPDSYYLYNYDQGDLLASRVKCLFFDSKCRMWVGTMGGGLSMCEPSGNYSNLTFTHYGKSEGLTNNIIQSIQEDNNGKIWVATEYGISRITPENHKIENFFFSSTVLGNVYSESSALRLPDGRLMFGTSHGMVVFDPNDIESPSPIASIALTGLKIDGITVTPNGDDSPLKSAITYTNKITLNHFQNSFIVEFSTFDYSTIGTARYIYMLENFETEWSTPSSLNFAAYKKLDPGTYILRVKAFNSAGELSDQEATLEIVIKPPIWKSTIAYLIYFCILIALSYFVVVIIHKFNVLRNRIQIEKQLTEFKLKFFTNISHEFRTPLTLIIGSLERLQGIGNLSSELVYPLQVMNKSTNRMLRLINQLLEFRKIQHDKQKLVLEKSDLIGFLKEIIDTFETLARDKQICFSFRHWNLNQDIFFDKGILDKVVYNLLSNAIKYTPSGGAVELSVGVNADDNQLVLVVSDTGIGIPPEKRSELFSRFMQSSFSHDSIGIGLNLTKDLVNLHNGSISYTENQGGGSIFKVVLPIDPSGYSETDFLAIDENIGVFDNSSLNVQNTTKHSTTLDEIQSVSHRKKILLIEDDIDVNNYLKNELSNNYDVISEMNGIAGLETAKSFDGDLIVCDVMMPGMNGFELTRQLKGNFETCHIPIILLTAMNSLENKLEGTQSGADAYITKPFSPKLLLAQIDQLINQRETLRDKFSKDPTMNTTALSTSELDEKFAEKLHGILVNYYSDTSFTLDDFAAKLKMGRTLFFRKVKGVTGYSPNEYLRVFRLKNAVELLKSGEFNVTEVAYKVGMNDPLYFSKCFKKQFGIAPSTYLRGQKETGEE